MDCYLVVRSHDTFFKESLVGGVFASALVARKNRLCRAVFTSEQSWSNNLHTKSLHCNNQTSLESKWTPKLGITHTLPKMILYSPQIHCAPTVSLASVKKYVYVPYSVRPIFRWMRPIFSQFPALPTPYYNHVSDKKKIVQTQTYCTSIVVK